LNIEGDTVVAITKEQSRKVNKAFIKANHYKTVSDSLGVKIVLLEAVVENDSLIIGNLKVQVDNLEKVITNNQEIIDKLESDLKETDSELRKEKRKNKFAKTVIGVSVLAHIVLLITSLIN
jgi:uncharacterized membrane protein YkgB